MKEVIKQFCEMLDKRASFYRRMLENKTTSFREHCLCELETLTETDEFIALKVLADRPIPKGEVTDEMELAAYEAYKKQIIYGNGTLSGLRAALETVLSMPVSEDNAQSNYSEFPNSSNDVWILNDGKTQPKNCHVELKFRNGKQRLDHTGGIGWWHLSNDSYDIIAYRIIDEPKWTCPDCCVRPCRCEIITQKEPSRQTLWQHSLKRYDVDELSPQGIILLISGYLETYLEQNKVDK